MLKTGLENYTEKELDDFIDRKSHEYDMRKRNETKIDKVSGDILRGVCEIASRIPDLENIEVESEEKEAEELFYSIETNSKFEWVNLENIANLLINAYSNYSNKLKAAIQKGFNEDSAEYKTFTHFHWVQHNLMLLIFERFYEKDRNIPVYIIEKEQDKYMSEFASYDIPDIYILYIQKMQTVLSKIKFSVSEKQEDEYYQCLSELGTIEISLFCTFPI